MIFKQLWRKDLENIKPGKKPTPVDPTSRAEETTPPSSRQQPTAEEPAPPPAQPTAPKPPPQKTSLFGTRLRRLFGVTSASFSELAERMEEELLLADFGITTTQTIIKDWRAQASGDNNKEQLLEQLRHIMQDLLTPIEKPLVIGAQRPFCLRMIGTNGVGKTTTLAKIAHYYKRQGLSLHLVAGDTFRAAAIDQLRVWGERLEMEVTYGKQYADSAAVIYDGIQAAQKQAVDLVIIDTTGMMTSAKEMTTYMRKVSASIKKLIATAPHETLLVLDASHGQSARMQAQGFCAATQVDGFCLTKMDSSAKGGIVFAMATEYRLPLRFIGTGEKLADLETFNSTTFLDRLLSKPQEA